LAAIIVDGAVQRHFDRCRARVPDFVDRNFALAGALRLHRHALGLDLLRVPANVLMILPKIGSLLGASLLRQLQAEKAADRLAGLRLFLQTDVGRELLWRLHTELLELPIVQGHRACYVDGIAREILSDARLSAVLADALLAAEQRLGKAEIRERLERALSDYTGARMAAADLTNGLLMLAAGAGLLQKLTPGAISMGPAVAGIVAQQAAIASFPLGAGLGGAWYGFFPAQPSVFLLAGSTAGLVIGAAFVATFSGVLSDPLLRRFGVHRRRLHRLLDTLERNLKADGEARFDVRDHYLTRVMDLVDLVNAALR
jgi:hypothetical protein